jgi:hypothetical protein
VPNFHATFLHSLLIPSAAFTRWNLHETSARASPWANSRQTICLVYRRLEPGPLQNTTNLSGKSRYVGQIIGDATRTALHPNDMKMEDDLHLSRSWKPLRGRRTPSLQNSACPVLSWLLALHPLPSEDNGLAMARSFFPLSQPLPSFYFHLFIPLHFPHSLSLFTRLPFISSFCVFTPVSRQLLQDLFIPFFLYRTLICIATHRLVFYYTILLFILHVSFFPLLNILFLSIRIYFAVNLICVLWYSLLVQCKPFQGLYVLFFT